MRQAIFATVFLAACASFAAAQTKTVTNADLSKFADARIKAERDYRENYAKMGMPSPEELDRMNAAEAIEREELSRKLRAERLERERLNFQREALEARARSAYNAGEEREYSYVRTAYFPYYYGGYYYRYPVRRERFLTRDPIFERHRGDPRRSYYPWMIIRTPTPTPNYFPSPRR